MIQQVIFERTGDLEKTASPRAFHTPENAAKFDFAALHSVQVAHDDFYQWKHIPKFFVKPVNIPSWATENFFLRNNIKIKYAAALAPDFVETLNPDTFLRFSALHEQDQYLIEYIYKRAPKNDFCASLLAQINQWLSEERPQNKFPLSPAQAKAAGKFCPTWKAKKITARLYWAGE
jgi:hypothetical protein